MMLSEVSSVTRCLNKSSQKFPQKLLKSGHRGYHLKVVFFKLAAKSHNNWAPFVRKFLPYNHKKLLNLVTLEASSDLVLASVSKWPDYLFNFASFKLTYY